MNNYRPLTVMYRISFERLCRKSITATYTIFNREHAGVTPINMCEFRSNQRIFTGVIVRTDRQTDKPKSLNWPFNLSWNVLKTSNYLKNPDDSRVFLKRCRCYVRGRQYFDCLLDRTSKVGYIGKSDAKRNSNKDLI